MPFVQKSIGTSVRCHSNFEENNSDSDTEDDFVKQEQQPSNLKNGELKEIVAEGDILLVKGSRGMHMEQVVEALLHMVPVFKV